MRGIRRYLFWTLIAVFWAATAGLCLEAYERYRFRAAIPAMQAYGQERWQAATETDAAIIEKYAGENPDIGADMRAREAFAAMDDEQRREQAAARDELVLVCDASGRIRRVYAGSSLEPVHRIAEAAREGDRLSDLLPPNLVADAEAAIQAVVAGRQHQPREYPVPQPDETIHVLQFFFYPFANEQGKVAEVGVFVRDSIWDVLWKRFKPNIHQNDAFDFRTNRFGFRDEEIAVPKPPGAYRIACVGGSTTAEGPSNDLTYPKMVQRKLRDHFKTDAIEVLNCGVFAVSIAAEVELLPDVLQTEPDLIVHYNFVNDLMHDFSAWIRPESVFGEPVKTLKSLLRRSHFLLQHCNRFLLPPEQELARRMDATILHNLRRIRAEARAAGVDMAVCSFARPEIARLNAQDRAYYDYLINTMLWGRMMNMESYVMLTDLYNRSIKSWAAEEGMRYIPVAEHVNAGTLEFTDICHMHLSAMERKAEVVAQALIEHLASRFTSSNKETQQSSASY